MHACMYTHTCMHACTHMQMLLNDHTPMHACKHTNMYASMHMHASMHVHMNVYIYILKSLKSKQAISVKKQIYTCIFTSSERSEL